MNEYVVFAVLALASLAGIYYAITAPKLFDE